MTDIVKRLRAVDHMSVEDCFLQSHLLAQAADEITRLRAALRGLLADTQHAEHRCGDEDCPVAIARAALRENSHD